MNNDRPTIHLELNLGTFKIKTDEAIYLIDVNPYDGSLQIPDKNITQDTFQENFSALPNEAERFEADIYYQEISEEIYSKIGKLARELSLSIREIPTEVVKGKDLEGSEIKLEAAKGELTEIIEMTEKATMDIMDLTESILSDCQSVRDNLGTIMNLDFMSLHTDNTIKEMAETNSPSLEENSAVQCLDHLLEKEERLYSLLNDYWKSSCNRFNHQGNDAGIEPVSEKSLSKKYQFDLKTVFQAMYELCTNEKVKSHIKAMGSAQETIFNGESVEHTLSEIAPDYQAEDNFFEFPLTLVLQALIANTQNERYLQILKKINQTAGNIFLDGTLPIEGRLEEVEEVSLHEPVNPKIEAPDDPLTETLSGLGPKKLQDLLSFVEKNINFIKDEKNRFLNGRRADQGNVTVDTIDGTTVIRSDDREVIVRSVENSHQILQGIINHITRILEALSFQDLSGQRLMKIFGLISHVQVQLLSILVLFGTKLKKKADQGEFIVSDTAKTAQEEVDKMIERVSTEHMDAGGGGQLDQDAVDQLLVEMGF